MSLPDSPPSVPIRRRRLHLSLRGLMVLVLVLGGGLGWMIHEVKVQGDATAALNLTGGQVYFPWQFAPGSRPNAVGPAWAPRWLVAGLGCHFFSPVTAVHLGERAGDAELSQVLRLRQLTNLALYESKITDARVADVAQLPRLTHLTIVRQPGCPQIRLAGLAQANRLEELYLYDLALTDADLREIDGLPKLRTLVLDNSMITDAGLAQLRNLPQLKSLFLDDMAITSAGLIHLAHLHGLTQLGLARTRVADLRPLAGLADLRSLDLSGAPVDDPGLAPLVGLSRLSVLNLQDTAFTAQGIDHIGDLDRLQLLTLPGPRISPEQQSVLQRLHPTVRIIP